MKNGMSVLLHGNGESSQKTTPAALTQSYRVPPSAPGDESINCTAAGAAMEDGKNIFVSGAGQEAVSPTPTSV